MNLSSNFFDHLCRKYDLAFQSGHLVYYGDSSKVEQINVKIADSQYSFVLTELQSLQHRPEKGLRDSNPFEKLEPELTVVNECGPNGKYRIVLNKFPVVDKHFMMVTTKFESQNSPLSPTDLKSTFTILTALRFQDPDHDWFAFYNCGTQSGASQPHKHIQFMMRLQNHGLSAEAVAQAHREKSPEQLLEPLQDENLPYAHFISSLPADSNDVSEELLAQRFVSLLQRTLTVLKQNEANHVSYNVLMTDKYLMLVPRSTSKFRDTLGINSCAFMGMILCKSEELVKLVKIEGPGKICLEVGFANTLNGLDDECSY